MVYNVAILRNQLESFPSEALPQNTGPAQWLYLKFFWVLWGENSEEKTAEKTEKTAARPMGAQAACAQVGM